MAEVEGYHFLVRWSGMRLPGRCWAKDPRDALQVAFAQVKALGEPLGCVTVLVRDPNAVGSNYEAWMDERGICLGEVGSGV